MIGKILCLLFGHKIDRLEYFKDRPMIRAIDPKEKKVMLVDACLRCGTVHARLEEFKDG